MFYPAHAKPQDDCVDAKLKEQIRELALQAFDDAFASTPNFGIYPFF